MLNNTGMPSHTVKTIYNNTQRNENNKISINLTVGALVATLEDSL